MPPEDTTRKCHLKMPPEHLDLPTVILFKVLKITDPEYRAYRLPKTSLDFVDFLIFGDCIIFSWRLHGQLEIMMSQSHNASFGVGKRSSNYRLRQSWMSRRVCRRREEKTSSAQSARHYKWYDNCTGIILGQSGTMWINTILLYSLEQITKTLTSQLDVLLNERSMTRG